MTLDTIRDINLKIQIIDGLSFSELNGSDEQRLAIQVLVRLIEQSNLTVEQAIQVLRTLYGLSSQKSEDYLRAIQLLWQRGQNTDIPPAERLSIVTIPIEEALASYADKLRSIQAIKSIVSSSYVKKYIELKWSESYRTNEEDALI